MNRVKGQVLTWNIERTAEYEVAASTINTKRINSESDNLMVLFGDVTGADAVVNK